MQYHTIVAMGKQLQRQGIEYGLSTSQLYEILKKMSNVIHDNVIRNYMKILSHNDFIVYDNGLWYILSEEKRNEIISKEKEKIKNGIGKPDINGY
jgi:hypothetical protein